MSGTEIVSADTRQRYREKLARITLDSMVQFVGLLDAQGTVLEINQVALDAVGIKLSEVEGRPFWATFWWQVSDEVNKTLRESIARAAQGEFVRWDTQIFGRAGGKEAIIVDASLCPVRDDDGNVVFICAEGRDITEKKAHEREIAQKNLELQGLLERIRELDEIKTQFFANVSHELRTPLALILGPAQRLMDVEAKLDDNDRRESAEVIARNAKILLKHVNDLLDLSKLEAGKLKIELRDADVAGLLRLVASHFEVLARDRRIDYRVEASAEILCAIDPPKLERVLMNLLSNAFKFVPDGGRVRCSIERNGGELTLAIDDSGPGVRPALRKLIFERFRQGDGGANRQFGGTGLGLAIAKEFVELHRGRIDVVTSNLGGARFQITLPVQGVSVEAGPASALASAPSAGFDRELISGMLEELAPSPVLTPTPSSGSDGARPLVLVVEDNADMNRFVAQSLNADYRVVSAYNGQEGLGLALALRPMLIISDLMMPVMSGIEMIAELRKRPELKATPVLILSAKADEELKVKLLASAVQDFITKPFSEQDLRVRVRNMVQARQSDESHQKENEVSEALYRVATSFASELDQQKLLQLVTDEATALTGAEFGSFFFNDTRDDGNAYLLYTLSGAPPEAFSSFRMPRATPLFGPTFRGEGIIRSDDVRRDSRYGQWGPRPLGHLPVVSYLAVPVVGRGGVVHGGLFFGHGQPGRFTELHERIVYGLAAQAAAALEKARLIQALRDSEARAREADRRKDEFLAMLGHELRNPLAPIMTALQLMKLRGESGSMREQQMIDRQVRHLARLVDDLLDIARVTRGKIQIEKQRIEVATVVEKAVELASPLFEQRHHQLRIEVPSRGLAVDADPGRLAQVVTNLLTNAAKYTEPGGQVVLMAQSRDGRIAISVKDNGQGIAPELLSRIFELFVQGERTIDRAQGGLGIGLALVRNLVELHGGSVEAKSAGPGKGSEFIIELAAAVGEATIEAPPKRNSAPVRPLRPGSRILVVDDNVDAAVGLGKALRELGHEVIVAHDGAQALAAAKTFRATAALLDIGLPVMDGYELARRLRELWARQPAGSKEKSIVMFVAITGYGQVSDREKALAAGFDAHLVKPVDWSRLLEILEKNGERRG